MSEIEFLGAGAVWGVTSLAASEAMRFFLGAPETGTQLVLMGGAAASIGFVPVLHVAAYARRTRTSKRTE